MSESQMRLPPLPPTQEKVLAAAKAAAAEGARRILLVGPPGSDKTGIARRLMQGVVPLNISGEVNAIYRMAGLPPLGVLEVPFRAPHHTASVAGMLGSGRGFRPGELSLAHGGVLFLDEVAGFTRVVLVGVRSVCAKGYVRYPGSPWLTGLPAAFTLVASALPCPCGYLLTDDKKCLCAQEAIDRYHERYAVLDFQTRLVVPPLDLSEIGG